MSTAQLPPPPPPNIPQTTPSTPTAARRWPWILGLIVALGAGTALGYGGTPEPEIQTEEVTAEVEVEPADMGERRAALDERETALDAQQSVLDQREADLDERETELTDYETQLDTREAELTATEQEVEENTIPGSGTFIVGDDINPGTYRSDGGDCYWARLSGTSGEFGDIITNHISDGTTYVTIAASDVAFETSGCGGWTLQ